MKSERVFARTFFFFCFPSAKNKCYDFKGESKTEKKWKANRQVKFTFYFSSDTAFKVIARLFSCLKKKARFLSKGFSHSLILYYY